MLDITKIQIAMFKLAEKMLSGEELSKVQYKIPLELPEELVNVLKEVVSQVGGTEEDFEKSLGKLATEGLNMKLHSMMNQVTEGVKEKSQNQELPKDFGEIGQVVKNSLGIDMNNMMEKLGELKNLGQQLQNLEKLIKNEEVKITK